MNRASAIALIAVGAFALGLTGCSNAAPASEAEQAPAAASTPDAAPTADAPALVAEETTPTTAEESFIAEARTRLGWLGATSTIPNVTDEQLIAAGTEACELLTAQTPFNDVSVIEGEPQVDGQFPDSAAISSAGILYLCPEMSGNTL